MLFPLKNSAIFKGNSIFYYKFGLQIPDLWSTLVDHKRHNYQSHNLIFWDSSSAAISSPIYGKWECVPRKRVSLLPLNDISMLQTLLFFQSACCCLYGEIIYYPDSTFHDSIFVANRFSWLFFVTLNSG